MDESLVGRQLGEFVIQDKLGEGGWIKSAAKLTDRFTLRTL